ncbi:anti-sigma factor [Paenibacillus sp. UNC499MF]|uniref:anti-sigma factor family protein n=1 Tax=Paenibacillus sp. UNC499MF TaxID=1502751 RepID=UPI00089FDFDF|nr:zf-HC2 domain-containing protein [Paenibacillus sp. UNC499MF]SEG11993.1 Putative zinc-finger [Paenibacillus sp. UNC499MF]
MKCEDVQEWLIEYIDGTASDLRRQAVRVHADSCKHCSAQFNAWQECRDLIRLSLRTDTPVPRVSIADSVMQRIGAYEPWRYPAQAGGPGSSGRGRKYRSAGRLAASFCLLLFVGVLLCLSLNSSPDFLGKGLSSAYEHAYAASPGTEAASAMNGRTMKQAVAGLNVSAVMPTRSTFALPPYVHHLIALSLIGLFVSFLFRAWIGRGKQ